LRLLCDAHLLDLPPLPDVMRLLRTLIMGGVMLIPGILLGFVIWYLAGGEAVTEPVETIICNGIPMLSVISGLVFGWMTGEAYSVKMDSN